MEQRERLHVRTLTPLILPWLPRTHVLQGSHWTGSPKHQQRFRYSLENYRSIRTVFFLLEIARGAGRVVVPVHTVRPARPTAPYGRTSPSSAPRPITLNALTGSYNREQGPAPYGYTARSTQPHCQPTGGVSTE